MRDPEDNGKSDEEDKSPSSETEDRLRQKGIPHDLLMLAFSWGVYATYLYINRETLKLAIGLKLLIRLVSRLLHLGV